MSDATRVLILEDLPTDAGLIMREVRRVLPDGEFRIVDARDDYPEFAGVFLPRRHPL